MRINVYSQELTPEIVLVEKVAETGIKYYGVRMYIDSPDSLHHTADDDDSSAITFWIPNNHTFDKHALAAVFRHMANIAQGAPDPNPNEQDERFYTVHEPITHRPTS